MSEIAGRLGGAREGEAESLVSPPAGEANAPATRWLRRQLASGVAAVTTTVEGVFRATTVGGVLVASIEPPMLMVSLELDGQMVDWIEDVRVFGVSVLSWEQQLLADRFAGFAPLAGPRFAGIAHFIASTGAPLLSDAIAWADCALVQSFDTGDHRSLVGEIRALGAGSAGTAEPLLYFRNRYRRLA